MEKLNIRSYGMLSLDAKGHAASWALCIHHLSQEFIKAGHNVFLNTTNGINGVPKTLLKYFRECTAPDIEFVYCTPNNYPYRFQGTLPGTQRAKVRCAILNYESSILPTEWAQYHHYVDYLLPSSEYCEDIFIRAGIPQEKIVVLPLGIDFETLNKPLDNYELKTKKRFKLLNISIPHARKNIPLLMEAYFNEFSADDDICLVIKTTTAERKETFEIDVLAAYNHLKQKYKKTLPEVEFIEHRFTNIATLYHKCDALINVAASEGFGLPLLEAMVCSKPVIAPRYGGVLDFLEHNVNSLLIDTIEIKAPAEYQYWNANPNAAIGLPIIHSIQENMRKMYKHYTELRDNFLPNMKKTIKEYTWENSAKIILNLYEGQRPKKKYGELL